MSGRQESDPRYYNQERSSDVRRLSRRDEYDGDPSLSRHQPSLHTRTGISPGYKTERDPGRLNDANWDDRSYRRQQAGGIVRESQNEGPKESGIMRTFKRAKDGFFRAIDDENQTPTEQYDYYDEVRRLEKHVGDLQAHYNSEVSALQTALRQERDRNEKMKESVNKYQFAMESKDFYIGEQDSDEMIFARFHALMNKIKTWSIPFAQGNAVVVERFSDTEKSDIQMVAPRVGDFQRFLQGPKNMRLFVRGLVGLVMTETIFRSMGSGSSSGLIGFDVWMDHELANATSMIEQRIYRSDRKIVPLRDMQDWRALTANIIAKVDTPSKTGEGMEAYIAGCISRVMSLVQRWVPPDTSSNLGVDLQSILLEAVEFSRTLRCQRALWTVRHLGGSLAKSVTPFFDEATMEEVQTTTKDIDGDDDMAAKDMHTTYRSIVEVIASPALFKQGNSDGDHFDVETCVIKCEVKSRQPSLGGGLRKGQK